jgi:pseudomonalisin
MFKKFFAVAVILCVALPIGLIAAIGGSSAEGNLVIDETDRVVLRGNVPPEARPEFDLGLADPSLPMEHIILLLKLTPEKQMEREQFLAEQLDQSSPNFHHWLTPEEYGKRFGRSPKEIAIVKKWLVSYGFTIDKVAKGRTWINFSGTAADVERAFKTQIHNYSSKGSLHHANSTEPSIPRALADLVAGPVSLHNFVSKPLSRLGRPIPEGSLQPEWHTNQGIMLAPSDFATIYNVNGAYDLGWDGTNVHIAIVGRTHPDPATWDTFRSFWGLPQNSPNVIVNGADPGNLGSDEDGEANLDVEWSGAVAKGAVIDFVTSKTTNADDGVDLSAQYIVDNNLAPIISISFGRDEAGMGSDWNSWMNELWAQAAGQGITVFVSSGDNGAYGGVPWGNQALAVSGFASTPYNVAVGGTQFNDSGGNYWGTNDVALSYIPEVGWDEQCGQAYAGSGGGVSALYSKPAWQVGPGVPQDGMRDVPDVALNSCACHVPYLVYSCGDTNCTHNAWWGVGGTSAAAPSFAGIMAIIVQSKGGDIQGRQGNANAVFYRLANAQYSRQAGAIAVFHDITSGNNGQGPGFPGYSCGVGYDQVTGLGSVDAAQLLQAFQSATHLSVTAPSSAVASRAFGISVTALDANNNTATGYSGTVHFTNSDPTANLPADSKLTKGTGTFQAILNTGGNQTIKATDTVTSSIFGTSGAISVSTVAANFSASATSGKVPLTVHFTDKSVGSIKSWLWNFGDGKTSTTQNPSHTYSKAGAYTVTLTVTGADGETSALTESNYITVCTAPKANFTAAPVSGKAPLPVVFTDKSTGVITSWLWNFGDGATSTVESPNHTYSKTGTYKAKLTVTGPGGTCSKTLSIRVTK